MFSGKAVGFDGIYKMLTVTGRWISQFEIKNGRIYSTGSILQKNKNNISESNQKTNGCIDWYLVTTYHYADGSTYQTREYVGTTCDGCSDPNYQSICPDNGGGGGGLGDPSSETETSGETTVSVDGSELPALPDLSGNLYNGGSGQDLVTVWRAKVIYTYLSPSGTITSMNGQQPYPVPASQPFIDANGNNAYLYNDCGTWSFTVTPLAPNSRYANFAFIGWYRYYFTTGVLNLPKNKYIAGVITAP